MNKGIYFPLIFLLLYTKSLCQEIVFKDSSCCSFPVYAVDINPNISFGNEIASSYGCRIKLWNISQNTFLESNNLEGHTDDITSIQFSPDGFLLASGSKDNNVRIWNLILRKEKFVLKKHSSWVKKVLFSYNGKMLMSCGKDGMVILWNPETGDMINKIYQDSVAVNTIAFNNTDELLAIGLNDGRIKVWDFTKNKIIADYNIHNEPVNSIVFFNRSNTIISAGNDKTIRIYNFENNTILAKLTGHTENINSLSIKVDSASNLKLVSSSDDETIREWDLKFFKQTNYIKQVGKVYAACITPNDRHPYSKLIISGSEDKKIKFWLQNENKEVAEIITLNNINSILKTSENYFYATAKAYSNIFFNVNKDETIPDGYLEYKYNRPDIVLKKLDISSEKVIAFEKAYLKRLTRSGIDSTMFHNNYFPQIKVKKQPPLTSIDKMIKLDLIAADSINYLAKILITTNGVTETINCSKDKIHIKDINKNIMLSNGKNSISVKAVNIYGSESKKISFEVFYTGEKKSEDLYIFSIGASNFKDRRYNLRYSSKDAADLLQELKKQNGFKNIFSYLLLDSSVTKKNIQLFKEILLRTSVDDEVIIFYSGNGLLSRNYDYYLSTYDVNFDKPEIDGFSYDDFQDLFKDIPARKRLMFIDADHSGTKDKDDYVEVNTLTLDTLKLIRGRIPDTTGKNVKPNNVLNSFSLMKEYFPEEQNENGIYQISSSSGNEFSLESTEIRNGIFTYSVLNALKDKKTDIDNDKEISFTELYQSISDEVGRLTNNLQHPEKNSIGNTDIGVFRIYENNDNKPPTITIVEPEIRNRGLKLIAVNNSTVLLKGVVNDESGIKTLSINGENSEINDEGGFKKEINLLEGENNIFINAEDIYGNKINQKITVINKGDNNPKFGKYYAIILGVSKYVDPSLNLDYPVSDALKLKKILINNYTFDSSNVSFIENPTRGEIYNVFNTLEDKLSESDNLLIFYAGHGAMREKADQGYWLPSDANKDNQSNWITNNDVITLIKPFKAKHILLITDACFSGKIFIRTRNALDSTNYSVLENNKMKCRRAITSGALTTVPDKSVFIEYLCDYLKTNKEKWLSSKKLYVNIKDDVTNRSQSHQIPLSERIGDTDDEGGDFIFIKR